MNYYDEVAGYAEDGLIGGEQVTAIVYNVKVTAAVVRGQLLSQGENGWSPVTAADASKPLAIAACDFTPDETHSITQAYVRGVFNAEKIKVGDGVNVEDFRQALRTQGIWLTSLRS